MNGGVLVVTGTDTDVGKTHVAAGLAGCLKNALYWKPVQAGVDPMTDREKVAQLSGISVERLLPEAYVLATPASPHLAASLDDIVIRAEQLALPLTTDPLIVEGAGGVLVPLNETLLLADLFARWRQPVLLVARTALGTINHSLLSIEALRARDIPIAGMIFVGDAHEENERIIPKLGNIDHLGRLPLIDSLGRGSLLSAMRAHINLTAIARIMGAELA
jgi:dethiobiotin synthetase